MKMQLKRSRRSIRIKGFLPNPKFLNPIKKMQLKRRRRRLIIAALSAVRRARAELRLQIRDIEIRLKELEDEEHEVKTRLKTLEDKELEVKRKLEQLESKEIQMKSKIQNLEDVIKKLPSFESKIEALYARDAAGNKSGPTGDPRSDGMLTIDLDKKSVEIIAELRNDVSFFFTCLAVLFSLTLFCGKKTYFLVLIFIAGLSTVWNSMVSIFCLNEMAIEQAKLKVLCREKQNPNNVENMKTCHHLFGFKKKDNVDVEKGVVETPRKQVEADQALLKWKFLGCHLPKVIMLAVFAVMCLVHVGLHSDQEQCRAAAWQPWG